MFTFLNSFLAWALFAAAIPILIHLFTRKKLKTVPFSTLRFLKLMQQEKIRQLKLRQMILLLLRMLIIVLLVLAFMRPTVKEDASWLGNEAHSAAAIVVDNSLSMAEMTRGKSRLSLAKIKAREIIETLKAGDEITLITAAQPAAVAREAPLYDPGAALTLLSKISETHAGTDIEGAISTALQALLKSHNLNRELYILSDNRFSLPQTGFDGAVPASMRIYVLEWPEEKVRNLALTALEIHNQIFEAGKVVELSVEVTNTGSYDETGRLVYLLLNGKRVAQQQVDVPAGQRKSLRFHVIPDTPGYQLVEARLEEDSNPLDNRRFTLFSIPERLQILLIGPEERDRLYVKLALQPDPSSKVFKIVEQGNKHLASINLDLYDVVVLCNLPKIPPDFGRNLQNFIRNGGGLMVFLGENVDLRNYNREIFNRFEIGRLGETLAGASENDDILRFGAINFDHAIFQNMFEKRPESYKIDSPAFKFAVVAHPSPQADVLIRYSNQAPYLLERRWGEGKILAFIGSANPDWSDITYKGIFVPLMNRAARYVAGRAELPGKVARAGEHVQVSLRGEKWKQFSLLTPWNTENRLIPKIRNDRYLLAIEQTPASGFYKLFADGELKFVLAVNFAPQEARQKPVDVSEVEKLFPENPVYRLPVNDELTTVLERLRFGKELWKLFLILALMLFIVETILFRESDESAKGGETVVAHHQHHA